VFLDPAELLACLARDFLLGDVAANWWWQAWMQASGRSTLQLVLDAWLREARHIPAAMARLQHQTLAFRFASALSATEARTLLVAVAHAFELPALIAFPQRRPSKRAGAALTAVDPVVDGRLAENERSSGARPRAVAPPWRRLGGRAELPATLDLEQATFAGVALSLSHAPLLVRTREFQRVLHVWRRAVASGASLADGGADHDDTRTMNETPSASLVGLPPTAIAQGTGADSIDLQPQVDTPRGEIATRVDPPTSDVSVRDAARERTGAAAETHHPRPHFVDTPVRHASHDVRASDPSTMTTPDARPVVTPAVTRTHVIEASAESNVHVDAVVTELGGILFLVNVLEHLQFFDRLDDHFRVKSTIGAWGWLEVVARCLLGVGHADAARDPIWDVTAELDGRTRGTPIAASVRIPRNPRLPDVWPAPARLSRSRARPLGLEPPADLRRLLDLVIPYLRSRLLTALDIPLDRHAPLASRLLYRHGRVEWTATHVDLHMEMSEIDIAVRLAGLDANPGWVPALGRVVTFHFH
jgi:hypothetical protein